MHSHINSLLHSKSPVRDKPPKSPRPSLQPKSSTVSSGQKPRQLKSLRARKSQLLFENDDLVSQYYEGDVNKNELEARESILIKKSASSSTRKRSKSRRSRRRDFLIEFKDSVLDVLQSLNLSTAAFFSEEKLKYETKNNELLAMPSRKTNSLKILKTSSSSQSKEGQKSIPSSKTSNQEVPTSKKQLEKSSSNKKEASKETSTRPKPLEASPSLTSSSFSTLKSTKPSESLSDLVSQAKKRGRPPKFPDLHICNVLPGTPDWENYWVNFNSQITNYNKAMNNYNSSFSDFPNELEQYSMRLKTFDDLTYQAKVDMRSGNKKTPIMRQPLSCALTLIGPYVIKRKIKTKSIIPSPITVHLTSYDHQSFRMEIAVRPTQTEFYKDLVADDTYFFKVDNKFNILLLSVFLPLKSNPVTVYREEIQIGVPVEKNVYTDLQISPANLNNGRIIINGK